MAQTEYVREPIPSHNAGRVAKTVENKGRMMRIMTVAAMLMAAATGAAPKVTGGPSWPGNTAPPERILDGNPKTYWAGDPKAARWQLEIDLGEARQLPAITIDYYSERYMARETTADISVDGTTWQPIGALPPTDPSCQPVGQPARYIRLTFVAKAKDKQPAIREVRFVVEEDDRVIGPCPYGGNVIDASVLGSDGAPVGDVVGELCLFLNISPRR